jgi:hypothetical protein
MIITDLLLYDIEEKKSNSGSGFCKTGDIIDFKYIPLWNQIINPLRMKGIYLSNYKLMYNLTGEKGVYYTYIKITP